jgi:hypothetical protein
MAASGDAGLSSAKKLVLATAQDQARRDHSWFRMTGFPKDVDGDIATVLTSIGSGG